MARAKRHYIPEQIWHLTHRCHKQEFLLKLIHPCRILLFCFISIFLFSTKQCFSSEDKPNSYQHLENVTLQLKWKHQFQFAGYYAALEKGFYRQAGLDVKIIEAQAGVESISFFADTELN